MANSDNNVIVADFFSWSGIDHITSPFLVKNNKFMEDVNFTSQGVAGGKRVRPSYVQLLDNPDGLPVRNLIYFVKQNTDGTTTPYLIRISGTHMYAKQVGSAGNSWGTALAGFTDTDTTVPFAYATFVNKLHLSNGVDPYQLWDGNTFQVDLSAPKATTLIPYQRRIFASGVHGASSRVYQSSVDYIGIPGATAQLTATYAAGVNSIQVGQNPAGISAFGGAGSTYINAILGSGTANQENVVVTNVTGTTAPYTLTLAANTANPHTTGETIVNNEAWYVDFSYNNLSSANWFDVDPEFNGSVAFLDVVNSNLTMHKSNSALYIYNGQQIGNPLSSYSPFFNAPGESTVSPYGVDQISGIEFYFDRSSIYAYQGGYPKDISSEIWDFIRNIPPSQFKIAPGIAFEGKYYLTAGDITDNQGFTIHNCIFVYDFDMNHWDTYSLSTLPTCWGQYIDASGNERLIFGDATGNVYQFNTVYGDVGVGDNGAANTALLQTHYLTFGAPERLKDIEGYSFFSNEGANFQVQFANDWQNNWQPFENLSGYLTSDRADERLKGFRSIAFRIIANTVESSIFYGFVLKVNVGSVRNTKGGA